MNKIKILYTITGLNVGGAEMMLYRILRQLKCEMYDISVVSLTNKGLVGKMIEDDLDIKIHSLGIKNGLNALSGMIRLCRIINTLSPSIVHSHMVHANLISRIIRLFCPIPVLISTIHNIEEKGSKKTAHWRLLAYRLTDPLCNLTTQVSMAGLNKYTEIKAVTKKKAEYIPNGIDISSFAIATDKALRLKKELGINDQYVFLAVGSMTEQKDYPNMLKAFAEVHKKASNAVLLIAGKGMLENYLHKITKELNLEDAVQYLGLHRDIPLLMNVADAFVISSAWEGLPIVLLEAAACSLPIIATDVGGNSEVVINNENGIIVPPRNPALLTRAMLTLIGMPREKQKQMGIKGYNHVKENYAIDEVTRKWESVYKRLLMNKGVH